MQKKVLNTHFEAIVSYAKEKSLEFLEVDHFEAIPGRGINATIDGKELFVGNRKLMSEKGIQTNEALKQISLNLKRRKNCNAYKRR